MADGIPRAEQADRARAAILDAAQRRFALSGYSGTTIRAVASDAAIDASMVMRYFGNKEGLFAAATAVDLAMPDWSVVPVAELGRSLARHFVDTWEHGESSAALHVLLSARAESAAADRMGEIFRLQVLPAVMAAGKKEPEDAARRSGLIATQVLGFALCRYILRLPPVMALDTDSAVESLAPVIQHYLLG
ncbi:TetR/AcrR family transcriptional regulator [Antrihabitans cavernicola]|uniref:TetR/AcrR family transcriptional regulator n=1 Tax=Antrihabitans cavernicola TaxID=2495913 RepID=A0A5A7SBR3_9NOCA|nr:TetR family transcriptional regulator [Spelaeibacter cavernicola]KAA0022033.1 TetR/AcrR family transcriptional regulator [Spelaeibacter cavernicola]